MPKLEANLSGVAENLIGFELQMAITTISLNMLPELKLNDSYCHFSSSLNELELSSKIDAKF